MYLYIYQESLQRTINAVIVNDDFKPVSNPLMYAARENSHNIVKVFKKSGVKIMIFNNLKSILSSK